MHLWLTKPQNKTQSTRLPVKVEIILGDRDLRAVGAIDRNEILLRPVIERDGHGAAPIILPPN